SPLVIPSSGYITFSGCVTSGIRRTSGSAVPPRYKILSSSRGGDQRTSVADLGNLDSEHFGLLLLARGIPGVALVEPPASDVAPMHPQDRIGETGFAERGHTASEKSPAVTTSPHVGIHIQGVHLTYGRIDLRRAGEDEPARTSGLVDADEACGSRSGRAAERFGPHSGPLLGIQPVEVCLGHEAVLISLLPGTNMDTPQLESVLGDGLPNLQCGLLYTNRARY